MSKNSYLFSLSEKYEKSLSRLERKSKGSFYTPEYIVNYIVENTVGEKIQGLTPKKIQAIKILDPSCGCGNFLIGAYSYLLQYHENWYAEHQQDKAYKNDWYLTSDGELKVRLDKRADILRNNIFGVDIDHEATEVSIMSLYLKMLDDGFDKGQQDLFFAKGSILPDMSENIKCGNSLIGSDYFDGKLDIDLEELRTIKPFDWAAEGTFNKETKTWIGRGFPEIMKNGGFDCVIGNPPYVDSEWMSKTSPNLRAYCTKMYFTAKGNWDIFCVFIEVSLKMIKMNGFCSLIVPNKLLSAEYAANSRSLMLARGEKIHIRDYSNIPVFPVAVYPIIFNTHIGKQLSEMTYERMKYSENIIIVDGDTIARKAGDFNGGENWYGSLNNNELQNIIRKMNQQKKLHESYNVTGAATVSEAYVIKQWMIDCKDSDNSFKFINSGTIDRYIHLWGLRPAQYIKSAYKFPKIDRNILKNHMANRFQDAAKSKIIIAGMTKRLKCCPDKGEIIAGKSTTLVFVEEKELFALSAILNSKLIFVYYSNVYQGLKLSGGYLRIGPPQIKQLPLPKEITKIQLEKLTTLVEKIIDAKSKYMAALTEVDKNAYERILTKYENDVDCIVYKLYDLTPDEIKIIEESTTP